MIKITENIHIPEAEIQFHFIRASGPGGQNVNRVASAVQLRFNVSATTALADDVKQRLARFAGRRLTDNGELIIDARRFRHQEQNRKDALDRLAALIQKALEIPKPRRKSRPSLAAVEKRIRQKKQVTGKKRERRKIADEE